jgi:hypothetical protein
VSVRSTALLPARLVPMQLTGRTRNNSIRRLQRAERRFRVMELLARYGMDRGVQARIARELGVSRVTISRDGAALLFDHTPCPMCGSFVPRDRFKR